MDSFKEIKQLLSENQHLKLQLEEANEILAIREEELELLRKQQVQLAEMRSRLDMSATDLKKANKQAQEEQQKTFGALARENAMEKELQDSLNIYTQYSKLMEQHTYLQVQYDELQEQHELTLMRSKQTIEQKAKLAQAESQLADALEEIKALKTRIEERENEEAV